MTDKAMVPASGGAMMSFGQTELDPGDIIMPRIKLMQAQSAEAVGKDAVGKAGEFLNTLTQVNLGDSFQFVPILPFKQRVLLVRANKRDAINAALSEIHHQIPDDANGLVCRSYDMMQGRGDPGIDCNECPLSKWDGQIPPLCTETYNVAAASEEGELIVLSFSRSSAKQGKQLFSMIRMRPGAMADLFTISSRSETGREGNYFVPMVRPGERAPDELIRQANTWRSMLAGAGPIDIAPDEPDEDAGDNPF